MYVNVVGEYVEPGDVTQCGGLNVSMYVKRGAAFNLHERCKEHLEPIGFRQGKPTPCIFSRETRDIRVCMHGERLR